MFPPAELGRRGLDLGLELCGHVHVAVGISGHGGRRGRDEFGHVGRELEGEQLVFGVTHAFDEDKVALHVVLLVLALGFREVNSMRGIHLLALRRAVRKVRAGREGADAAAVGIAVLRLVGGDHLVANAGEWRGHTGVRVRENSARTHRRHRLGLDAQQLRAVHFGTGAGASSRSHGRSARGALRLAPLLEVLELGLLHLLGLGLAAIKITLAVDGRRRRLRQRRHALNVNNARTRPVLVVRVHLDVRRVGLVPRRRGRGDEAASSCGSLATGHLSYVQFARDPPKGPAAIVLFAVCGLPPRFAPAPRPRARCDGRPRCDADEISGFTSSCTARRTGILGLNFILERDADGMGTAGGGASPAAGVLLPLGSEVPVFERERPGMGAADVVPALVLGPATAEVEAAGGMTGLDSGASTSIASAAAAATVVSGPGCDCAAAISDGRGRPGMRGRRGLTSRPDILCRGRERRGGGGWWRVKAERRRTRQNKSRTWRESQV